MYKIIFAVLVSIFTLSNVSAQECVLTSDGDYLSKSDFGGINLPTYINENSDIFIEIGDVLVDMDGYAQTTNSCDFSKSKDSQVNNDNEVVTITVTGGIMQKMPECLLLNDNGKQVNVIQSSKNALLFADNYYVYSNELQESIYVFRSQEGFLTDDKNITIEDECVIYPIT